MQRVNHLNIAIDLLELGEVKDLLVLNVRYAKEAKDKMAFDHVCFLRLAYLTPYLGSREYNSWGEVLRDTQTKFRT